MVRTGLKMAKTTALFFLLWARGAGAQNLEPPRSVEAIATGAGAIRVWWLPVTGAAGYRVLRDGQTIAEMLPTATDYEDNAISPGSQHTYRVQAESAGGDGPLSPPYIERAFAPFPTRDRRGKIPIASFDVIVTQASSGGVSAAIEAARRGLSVALVEPTTRLGGMPVNGLSATDLRRDAFQSGFFVRFRERVVSLYAAEGLKQDGRKYEPRIAHQAMKSLLYETPNLTIFRRARLSRVRTKASHADDSRRVVTAVTIDELNADGEPTGRKAELRAKVFIDATDCGDLAAGAGARFHIGREPRSRREPHNGVIYYERKTMKALPGSTGQGDRRIQAYSYLVTVKDYGPNADRTIPKPAHYAREEFLDPTLPDWKSTWAYDSGVMPYSKHELNQHPRGADLQGTNYAYPTGDYKTRARIEKGFYDRAMRYLYFIQTEYGMKNMALPDDEYRDSGGFPPLLYVREGRRILGEQTPDEADITDARKIYRPESVGIGDYPMDSHAVRPKTDNNTRHMGEGEWWLVQQTPWHQLPLGICVPQGLDNVFVTTAVSSTHVSFGTYRMEPVRMALGQAAGIAASIAIRFHKIGREVPARQIQDELLPHLANPYGDPHIVLHYFSDVPPAHKYYRAIQYMAARGFLPSDSGDKFLPDKPVTPEELEEWMNLLGARGNPIDAEDNKAGGETLRYLDSLSYMGSVGARGFNRGAAGAKPEISRWNLIRYLVGMVRDPFPDRAAPKNVYADLEDAPYKPEDDPPDAIVEAPMPWTRWAAILHECGVDSRLWDSWEAYAPDGRLLLRPDKPVTRGEAFAAFYIVQIGLGPLFNDHPIDGVNGRYVPPAPPNEMRGGPEVSAQARRNKPSNTQRPTSLRASLRFMNR